MRILQASVLVSALLVLLVPDLCLAQDEVLFADPAPTAPPEGRSDLQKMLDNGIVASELTQDDLMAIMCNVLQDVPDDCTSAMQIEEYAMEHNERLFGLSAPPLSRKKRDSRQSSSPNNPSSASSYSGHRSSYRSNSYRNSKRPSGYRRSELLCPSPIDQSAIYQLNEDLQDPIDFSAIVNELGLNPNLTSCLFRQLLVPGEPPQVIVEDFLQQAKATCPSTEQRLMRYESVRFSGQCFVLNVGDVIVYKECSANRHCQGCQDYSSRSTSQKLCIPEYRAVNFWAYCPSQSPGKRFVRDKIIIPVACNCLDVPCERVFPEH
ncbi:uncharacterized protein [Littorina saxatilis]|uniref:Uncharacterized protein n=1 Tax=Littorina saxatilis TaxID=31220 RepID=A0AAN9G7Q1_9CAEN